MHLNLTSEPGLGGDGKVCGDGSSPPWRGCCLAAGARHVAPLARPGPAVATFYPDIYFSAAACVCCLFCSYASEHFLIMKLFLIADSFVIAHPSYRFSPSISVFIFISLYFHLCHPLNSVCSAVVGGHGASHNLSAMVFCSLSLFLRYSSTLHESSFFFFLGMV